MICFFNPVTIFQSHCTHIVVINSRPLGIFLRRNNFEVMDNASIKENIFRIRTEKGLSQDEMARKLGVVRNTYRKIEKGDIRLISEHVSELAMIFGISEEELILGYKPAADSGLMEDARAEYDTRLAALTSAYENTISRLRGEIESRDAEIRDLRSMIEDKNEIISLLKRNSSI